jgi:hypothetical protein
VLRKGTKKSIYLLLNDPNAVQSSTGEKDEETVKKPVIDMREEKEESEFIKFVNKYPILVAAIAIIGFFIILLILSKINKIKY